MANAADWPAGTPTWSGSYIGFKAAYDALNVPYTIADTPVQNLNGAMLGVTGGMDFQNNNLVLGVAGDVTFGNLTAFVRDGNYITESGKVNALGTLRGRVGVAMGGFLPYFTGGITITSLEQGEVCPDPAAAPFGFCNHGFPSDPINYPPGSSPGPFDLKQSKTLVGATVGGGVEFMIASGWSLQAQYLHTFLPTTTYILSPDSDGKPLPPSEAHPTLDEASLTFVKRF